MVLPCSFSSPCGYDYGNWRSNSQLEQALRMTYDAMPEPRLVMACGARRCGETFGSTYAIVVKLQTLCPWILLFRLSSETSAMIVAPGGG